MIAQRAPDIWMRVLFHETDEFTRCPPVIPVRTVPQNLYGAAKFKSSTFRSEQTAPLKVANRSIRHPMEEVTFVHHLDLPRKEHFVATLLKKLLELRSRLALRGIRRTTARQIFFIKVLGVHDCMPPLRKLQK